MLSLKTSDIPGAMGKSKIYEKKLVYNGVQEHAPVHLAQNYHNSQYYGQQRRMYEHEEDTQKELPDPYELEQNIRNSEG